MLRIAAIDSEWCVSFTITRPNIPLILCFCCPLFYVLETNNKGNNYSFVTYKLYILYAAQNNSSSLNLSVARQNIVKSWIVPALVLSCCQLYTQGVTMCPKY